MRQLYHLLIFVGLDLHAYVQCQMVCRINQYTLVQSDGRKSCLFCATCHAGRGLHPPCGMDISFPPEISCVTCPVGQFSDQLDSAPCHSCQRCAEHEIETAPCTNRSNRICNGTCEVGYFYSKRDSSHSCKKCSYCCLDGEDEEIPECVNQGLKPSKQHCHPRPDKDCSPGSTVISPTTQTTRTDASTNGSSISGGVIGSAIGSVIGGMVFIVVVVIGIYKLCLLRRQKAVELSDVQQALKVEEGNGMANCTSPHAQSEGPQVATANNQVGFPVPADTNMTSQVILELQKSALEEKSGETAAPTTANQADDKIENLPDVNMSDKPLLSRQSSQDSQNSGDGETEFKKRSNSAIGLEKLTHKLSERGYSLLEQEMAEEIHETITIIEEPSSQKIKEGLKVELVFKCKAPGNSKLTYQWYKDGSELQGKDKGTLVLKSVTLPDFGWYKCVASCKDSPCDSMESSLAELNVAPRDGRMYKCLKDLDISTQDRIEDLLTLKRYGLGRWREVAFKYGMDHLKIKSLESDPEAGKKTLEYLGASNPDLTIYDFCKTLKEHNIRRLDIVKELLGHLSVPSSSKVYV